MTSRSLPTRRGMSRTQLSAALNAVTWAAAASAIMPSLAKSTLKTPVPIEVTVTASGLESAES